LLIAPIAVLAHAELDTATPADKSSVAVSPTRIVFTFTEPVDPAKSSLKLVDAGGAVIAQGSTVDPANPKAIDLVISIYLQPGTYTIRWITASALDGDLDHGTTTFTATTPTCTDGCGPGGTSGAAPSSATPSSSDSGSVGAVPSSLVPSPSSPPTVPAASSSDAVVPLVVALVILAGLGLWLMRVRSRGAL
jgi:methionine-rich copper-binding protein CopC